MIKSILQVNNDTLIKTRASRINSNILNILKHLFQFLNSSKCRIYLLAQMKNKLNEHTNFVLSRHILVMREITKLRVQCEFKL